MIELFERRRSFELDFWHVCTSLHFAHCGMWLEFDVSLEDSPPLKSAFLGFSSSRLCGPLFGTLQRIGTSVPLVVVAPGCDGVIIPPLKSTQIPMTVPGFALVCLGCCCVLTPPLWCLWFLSTWRCLLLYSMCLCEARFPFGIRVSGTVL